MMSSVNPRGDAFMERMGAWAFRQRSWLPVPLALVLIVVSWRSVQSPWAFYAGGGVVLGGLAVRMWAVRRIGTISRTRANRQGPLITSGPYAWVRNPLYVGNWLLWTGCVLLSELLWMLPVAWAIFALQYGAIAAYEESRLRGHYGAAYDEYARVVPRWMPRAGPRWTSRIPPTAHPWPEVVFSERGTLIAAAAMTILLILKRSFG